jgi:hypothetical protein
VRVFDLTLTLETGLTVEHIGADKKRLTETLDRLFKTYDFDEIKSLTVKAR